MRGARRWVGPGRPPGGQTNEKQSHHSDQADGNHVTDAGDSPIDQRVLRLAEEGVRHAWGGTNPATVWRLIAQRDLFLPEVLLPDPYSGRVVWAERAKAHADFARAGVESPANNAAKRSIPAHRRSPHSP